MNSSNSRMLRWSLLAAALVLAGCGFHVRGNYRLPESVGAVFIDVPGYDYDLRHRLQRELGSRGVRLVDDATAADSILRISNPEFKTRVLSVGVDARVRENELRYTLGFDMRRRDGSVLVKRETVELFRDVTYDETNVLGSQSEAASGRLELQDRAVQQIMRRLTARLS